MSMKSIFCIDDDEVYSSDESEDEGHAFKKKWAWDQNELEKI